MFKIGEVAKKTGVSMRSLRHYDKLGLLSPSGRSASGYRLYNNKDIYRLQQIVSLKQMNLPLQTIQSMLLDDAMTLQQTLQIHRDFLRQQLKQQQLICRNIDDLLVRLDNQETLSLEAIYNTMEAIKMLETYFSTEQREALQKRTFNQSEAEGKRYAEAWTEIFMGLEALRKERIEPEDERTKLYALKAKDLVQVFTAGDKGIEQSLKSMVHQEGPGQMLRSHGLPVTDELAGYYALAMKAHAK